MTISQTKIVRGARDVDGKDWKKGIILFVDNYKGERRMEIRNLFLDKLGIPMRDQDGVIVRTPIHYNCNDRKMTVAEYIAMRPEYWKIEKNFMRKVGVILKRPTQYNHEVGNLEKDGVIVRTPLIPMSWQNLGIYNNINGTVDHDIKTLHVDGNKKPSKKRLKTAKKLIATVTLRKNPLGFVKQINQPYRGIYSIQEASENSLLPFNLQKCDIVNYKLIYKRHTKMRCRDLEKLFNKIGLRQIMLYLK